MAPLVTKASCSTVDGSASRSRPSAGGQHGQAGADGEVAAAGMFGELLGAQFDEFGDGQSVEQQQGAGCAGEQ
jgi:hypothetical protein